MGPATGQAGIAAVAGHGSRRFHFAVAVFAALIVVGSSTATATTLLSERVLLDSARSTPAAGTYGGADTRTLRTLVWRPAAACTDSGHCAPFPLLLMAHGMSGLPESFDAFARTMAEGGYVVAAPAFPLTNADSPSGSQAGFPDTVRQPDDLAFVAGELLAAAQDPGDPLFELLDPGRLAALGVSLGGATVEALAHTDCCGPLALEAAVMAGTYTGILQMFGGQTTGQGPTSLILHGTEDQLIPFSTVPALLELLPVPRFVVGLEGAEHDDYIDGQSEPATPERAAAELATLSFLNWKMRDQETPFTEARAVLAADGHTVVTERCLAEEQDCEPACTANQWSALPTAPPDQRPRRAMLKLRRLDSTGRAKLVAKGMFNPTDGQASVDPAADGVHLRVGVNGKTVYDLNLPAAPLCSERDGWKVRTGSRTVWKYKNRSGQVGPLCANDSARGMSRLVIKDLRSSSKQALAYKVKVKKTTLQELAEAPLTEVELALSLVAQAELGLPSAGALAGHCALDRMTGEPIPASAPKPYCTSTAAGGRLSSILCKGL